MLGLITHCQCLTPTLVAELGLRLQHICGQSFKMNCCVACIPYAGSHIYAGAVLHDSKGCYCYVFLSLFLITADYKSQNILSLPLLSGFLPALLFTHGARFICQMNCLRGVLQILEVSRCKNEA